MKKSGPLTLILYQYKTKLENMVNSHSYPFAQLDPLRALTPTDHTGTKKDPSQTLE